jgi:hypothetical protein
MTGRDKVLVRSTELRICCNARGQSDRAHSPVPRALGGGNMIFQNSALNRLSITLGKRVSHTK